MYLHKDRGGFKEIVEQVADATGCASTVIEKDYYVTVILKLLAEKLEHCVFKGGTSLSKGFRVIDRFSEDIDITFDEHIGESRRKKLKNTVLKGISEELGLPIANWDDTQSDRDYNLYKFEYGSVFGFEDDRLPQYIKLETALGSYSFPTQMVEIGNYIGDFLESREKTDIAEKFQLNRFSMKVQALERTYIDKVFALCDYYMQGKSKRYSRHLYDIYKLTSMMKFDEAFTKLIKEVREHRAKMLICPSAQDSVDVSAILKEICSNDFYKEDYQVITSYFVADFVSYEDVIDNIKEIANSGIFCNSIVK